MRMIRRLATGVALATLVPALVQAQEGRRFTDSWFWGVKASNLTFWTTQVNHAQAQGLGLETLITRTHGALYISAEHYFFGETFDFDDGEASSVNGQPVNLKSMRRATAALMTFPKNFGGLRPYAGAGFSFHEVDASIPPGSLATTAQVDSLSSRIAPVFMLGLQAQYQRFSVFGQGTAMPAKNDSFLNAHMSYIVEGGIRWNFGKSIARGN